jgi:hypothetical protein
MRLHLRTLTRRCCGTSLGRMTATIRVKRWRRLEYEQLIELGIFRGDERLELLGGNLLVASRRAIAMRWPSSCVTTRCVLRSVPIGASASSSRSRSTTNQNQSPICRWYGVDLVRSSTNPSRLVPR